MLAQSPNGLRDCRSYECLHVTRRSLDRFLMDGRQTSPLFSSRGNTYPQGETSVKFLSFFMLSSSQLESLRAS